MNKVTRATLPLIAAVFLTALGSNPAHAAPVDYAGCATTGASGAVKITNWYNPGEKVGLSFTLSDIKPDGHHVRIRLVSKQYNDARKNWPWRKNTRGSGRSQTWSSSASDSNGLFEIGVQVARFEGNKLLNSCTDWA